MRYFSGTNTGNNKWYGLAASPDAEVHRADRMANEIAPFNLLTGSKVFGDWVQILGSTDTPLVADRTLFNLRKLLITVTDSTNPFVIQIITGEAADLAAKVAIESFDECVHVSTSVGNDSGTIVLKRPKIKSGTKVWMRACCINESAKNISFYFGLQEYNI